MKIWFTICSFLCGGLLTIQILMLDSCSDVIVVDDKGEQLEKYLRDCKSPSEAEFYRYVAGQTRSGDKIEATRTITWFPIMDSMSYEELVVFRDGQIIAIHRFGKLEFYLALSAISASPLLLWCALAAIIRFYSPRPSPVESGAT